MNKKKGLIRREILGTRLVGAGESADGTTRSN